PDDLAFDGNALLFSSGSEVLTRAADKEGRPVSVARFDAPVAALAGASDGTIAVALDDGRIVVQGGQRGGSTLTPSDVGGLACPTALAFAGDGALLVCQGAAGRRPSDWVVDLMEKGVSGSVWRVDLAAGRATRLAGDLAFPYGVLADAPGGG